VSERPTVDEVLRANGVDGRWLIGIVRKALNDGLGKRAAYLPPDRFDEAHGFLMLAACRAVVRFDPAYGQALSTFVYRRTRPRLTDWYRSVLGDTRYPDTWAARHSLLFAERLEDEPDEATYEDSYELDDDHALDRAEEELGRGLSEEARRGLHLYRIDEEHGHRVNAGKGSELARKAVRAELAARR